MYIRYNFQENNIALACNSCHLSAGLKSREDRGGGEWARNPILATPISGPQSRAQEQGSLGPGPPAPPVPDHPANASQFNHSTDLITL